MIISVIVRTHNEERNLNRFILGYYNWVDYILVQDDQSDNIDYIINAVETYSPKVQFGTYSDKRMGSGDISRAYHHIQLNQLIDWAEELNSDWIIMDDCDCFPNRILKNGARELLENCEKDFIFATRVYFYKDGGFLSNFCSSGGVWQQGIWAWKANKEFRFIDDGARPQKFDPISDERILRIKPPLSLLHFPWPDNEVINEKRKRYSAIYGSVYNNFDPLRFGGKLLPPEDWMVE